MSILKSKVPSRQLFLRKNHETSPGLQPIKKVFLYTVSDELRTILMIRMLLSVMFSYYTTFSDAFSNSPHTF